MSSVSAGSHRGWRNCKEQSHVALEVVLLGRTYLLPWTQFLYAEGGDDEAQLVFETHDVRAKGFRLGALLADVAAQRLIGMDEPGRAEKFGGAGDHRVLVLAVRKVES